MNELMRKKVSAPVIVKPRLGFLGVGWIGRNRMEAIVRQNKVEAAAIADPVEDLALKARELAPEAEIFDSMDALLIGNLDAIVIATPSALHAEQAIAAFEAGKAVFCQKPLGRNVIEVCRVIDAAKAADRLLSVDLSYRYLDGIRKMKQIIDSVEIGNIYAVNLVFHNSYGPDKQWFYDPKLSGGGCVIDLGIHLVDLVLWILSYPKVSNVSARLYTQGRPVTDSFFGVEDFAIARFDLNEDTTVNLSCSWHQSLGRDAVIEASFYGTKGGLSLSNINGSFYDFKAERFRWTASETLSEPPDDWSARAAIDWIDKLTSSNRYDREIEHMIQVSETIDAIYGRINL